MIWLEVKWRGRVDLAFYLVLFAKQKCDVTRAVGTKKVHFPLHHQTYENKKWDGIMVRHSRRAKHRVLQLGIIGSSGPRHWLYFLVSIL